MSPSFCLYHKNDQLHFGWIKNTEKNRYRILSRQGVELVCSQRQAALIWEDQAPPTDKEVLEKLERQSRLTLQNAEDMDVKTIYDLLDPENSYNLDEMADSFLDDPKNGWMKAALYLALKNNKLLFRQKKECFAPRSEEEIELMEESERKKQEQEEALLLEKKWAECLLEQKKPEITETQTRVWNKFLNRLFKFLVYFEKSQEKAYFAELFHLNTTEPTESERKLLNCLNLADRPLSWGKMQLLRCGIELKENPEEKAIASEIALKTAEDSLFNLPTQDLRELTTYSIDSATTRDYDDAFSFAREGQKCRIWVHVADVASYIEQGSLLFQKAEQRVSTFYSLKGSFSMIDKGLSEDRFSLIEKKVRPVMCFEVELDSEANLTSSKIYRALIEVDQNMSYETADEAIRRGTGFWPDLIEAASKLKQKRMDNGALDIQRVEAKLDITDEDNIILKTLSEPTESMNLVQELAILANREAARYCAENRINCLFRNQPPYTVNPDLPEGEKPKMEDLRIQSAQLNLTSDGHAALGIDHYLQATSPIRRFLDLVAQGAIFGHLSRQTNIYQQEDLLSWVPMIDEKSKEYAQTDKKLNDHWKIRYLNQHLGETFKAKVVRRLRNQKALVCLIDLQFFTEMTLLDSDALDYIQVVVGEADPYKDRVVLKKFSPSPIA